MAHNRLFKAEAVGYLVDDFLGCHIAVRRSRERKYFVKQNSGGPYIAFVTEYTITSALGGKPPNFKALLSIVNPDRCTCRLVKVTGNVHIALVVMKMIAKTHYC